MSELLNEPWVAGNWKPADKVESHWKDDDEMVTVIPADEAGEPRRGRSYSELEAEAKVATIRSIPNADEHHNVGVSNLRTALDAAVNFLSVPRTGAKAWAANLPYGEEVTELIDEALDKVNSAIRRIDVNENS